MLILLRQYLEFFIYIFFLMEEGGGLNINWIYSYEHTQHSKYMIFILIFLKQNCNRSMVAGSLVTVHEFWTTYLVIDKEILYLQ